MTIGRRRSLLASTAASKRLQPACFRYRAVSTIRIAFLAARPTRTMNPTCTKMFRSSLCIHNPTTALSRHIGTTSSTATGMVQLSYCAARTRYTSSTAPMKAKIAALPSISCRYVNSVHSKVKSRVNSVLARPSIMLTVCPELTPGRDAPLMVAAVLMLYRVIMTGPPISLTVTNVPKGTICPLEFRTLSPLMSSGRARKAESA